MPELPEVETIKLGLQKKILGLQINSIEILNSKTFQGDESSVIGGEIVKVWRAAKMLGIDVASDRGKVKSQKKQQKDSSLRVHPKQSQLTNSSSYLNEASTELRLPSQSEAHPPRNDVTLLFHLKMSGQVIYKDGKEVFSGGHPTQDMKDAMPNKSTRVVFSFSDGSKMYFNDQRKFGWIKIIQSSKLKVQNLFNGLGPEPLDNSFTAEVLKEQLLKHKNWPVKVAIMDQQTISGIGNIYAAEACFDAKLDPRIKVGELSEQDFELLQKGIIRSLKDGIKYGGSSRANFVNAEGEKGLFLDYAYVYGRKDEPCKVCKTPIEKIVLGGRGTFFCPKCQRVRN